METGQGNDMASELQRKEIRLIIEQYKSNFSEIDRQERYKWKAAGWYRKHWNIDAADFPAMLSAAFEKADNLLTANMYWPHKMMMEFAQASPETVRHLFRILYDEHLPLAERYEAFREGWRQTSDYSPYSWMRVASTSDWFQQQEYRFDEQYSTGQWLY